jgi:hypothetical protein
VLKSFVFNPDLRANLKKSQTLRAGEEGKSIMGIIDRRSFFKLGTGLVAGLVGATASIPSAEAAAGGTTADTDASAKKTRRHIISQSN